MTTNCESRGKYLLDEAERNHWERHEAKTAAFLLVIPGSIITGFGIGLLAGHMIPCSIIGFGAGLLIWGLIVALTT